MLRTRRLLRQNDALDTHIQRRHNICACFFWDKVRSMGATCKKSPTFNVTDLVQSIWILYRRSHIERGFSKAPVWLNEIYCSSLKLAQNAPKSMQNPSKWQPKSEPRSFLEQPWAVQEASWKGLGGVQEASWKGPGVFWDDFRALSSIPLTAVLLFFYQKWYCF